VIKIIGETQATFAWNPAGGAVAGYSVYVSRNGSPARLDSTVTGANRQTIYSRFGETIQVSVAAFDGHGNMGPRSGSSEEVHFVRSSAAKIEPTATPSPTAAPTPTPSPTPSTSIPPTDGTPPAEDPLPGSAVAYDFNGDGYSDILFRNATTGELEVWQMLGTQVVDVMPLPMTDPRWLDAGAGDFDLDGITDILWYDPDHRKARIWLMGDSAGVDEVNLQLPAGGVVVGAGDFDGDGRDEIVTWDQSSRVEIWGLKKKLVRFARMSIGGRREIAGFGDVDGDGDDDLIVQDQNKRAVEALLMSTGFSTKSVLLDRQRKAQWSVIDSADYDGDGQYDLLRRDISSNGQGAASVWHVTRSLDLSGNPLVLNLESVHSVVGSADYDGDGSADLLIYNSSTRDLELWLMSGSGVRSYHHLGALAADWLPAGFNTADDTATQ
jgi:hypothetical protein